MEAFHLRRPSNHHFIAGYRGILVNPAIWCCQKNSLASRRNLPSKLDHSSIMKPHAESRQHFLKQRVFFSGIGVFSSHHKSKYNIVEAQKKIQHKRQQINISQHKPFIIQNPYKSTYSAHRSSVRYPLSCLYTAWLKTGFPSWLVTIPNILASRLPKLINQQGFRTFNPIQYHSIPLNSNKST